MARVIFPTVLVLAALLAAACGGDDSSRAEPPVTIEPPQGGPVRLPSAATLEEARELVPFDIRAPSYLPEGVRFQGARSLPAGPLARTEGAAQDVLFLYYHDGSSRYLELKQNLMGTKAAGVAEPIRVNGVMGEIVYGEQFDRPGGVSISWTKDGMSFLADASTLSEEWTLDDVLAVLDSIR